MDAAVVAGAACTCTGTSTAAAARQIIAKLSEEMGVQFVIVTHIAELQIGKVVEL